MKWTLPLLLCKSLEFHPRRLRLALSGGSSSPSCTHWAWAWDAHISPIMSYQSLVIISHLVPRTCQVGNIYKLYNDIHGWLSLWKSNSFGASSRSELLGFEVLRNLQSWHAAHQLHPTAECPEVFGSSMKFFTMLPKPKRLNLTKRIRLTKPSNANAFTVITTYAIRTLDCGLRGGQKRSVEIQLYGSACLRNMLPASTTSTCRLKNGGWQGTLHANSWNNSCSLLFLFSPVLYILPKPESGGQNMNGIGVDRIGCNEV